MKEKKDPNEITGLENPNSLVTGFENPHTFQKEKLEQQQQQEMIKDVEDRFNASKYNNSITVHGTLKSKPDIYQDANKIDASVRFIIEVEDEKDFRSSQLFIANAYIKEHAELRRYLKVVGAREGSLIRVEGRVYSLQYDSETKRCDKCNQLNVTNRREPRIHVRKVWIENRNKDKAKNFADLNRLDKSFARAIEEDEATGYRK